MRSSLRTAIVRCRQCWPLLLVATLWAGCARDANPDVEVVVSRVAFDPDARAPVVLLEDKAHTVVLPIWIGPAEAQSIASRLAGVEPPRPLTHDLMKTVMDRVGVGVQRVVIRGLHDQTYYATLVLLWRGEEVEVDSRPSDAIAIAMRFGQPIFVDRALLEGQDAIALRGADATALGVDGITVQALSPDLADAFHVPAGQGVVVVSVGAGSDLRRGDVIVAVDGQPVTDPADFRTKLHARNGRITLMVERDGARLRIAVESAATRGVD